MSTRQMYIKRLGISLIAVYLLLDVGNVSPTGVERPIQCRNYTNLTEDSRNINSKTVRIPKCDRELPPKGGWYRFSGAAGTILSWRQVRTGMCGAESPGRLLENLHPCRKYDTTDGAKVCFVNSNGKCGQRVKITITLCEEYYVYYLSGFNNCEIKKKRYCGEHSELPIISCNVTSTPAYYTKSNVNATDWHQTSTVSPRNTEKDLSKDKDALDDLKKKVDNLDHRNTSDEDVQEIVDKLSNLTDLDNKRHEGKQRNGINKNVLIDAVGILQKIVQLNISNSSAVNILEPANNILDQRNTKSWKNIKNDKVLRDLVTTLENNVFQQGEKLKENQTTNFSFQNYSNVQLHTKYIKQPDHLSQEERLFQFPNASFKLSRNALPEDASSSAMIVVIWYKTLDSFVRNRVLDHRKRVRAKLNSKIITASVRPAPRVKFLEPVRISWKIGNLRNDSATCVYWKPELGEATWKKNGCKRVNNKKNNNRLICECNHLTAFAAMDISIDMQVNKAERRALELISTVGCSFSLFGIFLTILTHAILWKRLQQNVRSNVPSQVLMHLCVAIGMIDILAIIAGPAQNHEKSCIALSMILYFFVLAVFGWMLCEGIIIYLQLVNVYTGLSLGGRHLRFFYLIGWGIPVIIVSVLVGLNNPEDFITRHACWCPAGGLLFWIFVSTIGFILLINIIIFTLALRSALSSWEVSTTKGSTSSNQVTTGGTALRKAKIGLKGSAILLPLLGLTWIFGLFVFNRDTIVFKYLFAICNSLQGLMIFVFHVLINKKVHEAIRREKRARKTRHITIAMSNNFKCETLSTSESRSRKSSLGITPFLPNNFNNNSLGRNNATMENKTLKNTCKSSGQNRVILEDLELKL